MATAKHHTWSVNDKLKVSVKKDNPAYIPAKIVLQCFVTSRANVDIKTDFNHGKIIVQFPVPKHAETSSRDKLKDTFKLCVKKFVTKDKNFVLIPIDDIKHWPKGEFCDVILEEVTTLVEIQKGELITLKLEFCSMEDRNFGEAVKACEARFSAVLSKPVAQKVKRYPGPSICIVKDSLENIKADAIACTTSQDFNLQCGGVSAALLKKGGYDLQRDLNLKCKGTDIGEIIPVSGHRLNCKMVFFGVIYIYNPKHARGYKSIEDYYRSSIHDFIQRCLNLANKMQLRSVAFPAIGSGVLNYPVNIVADQMFMTVIEWTGIFVEEVKFVIYPKNTAVLQEFEQAQKKYGFSQAQASVRHSSGSRQTSEFYLPSPESKVGSHKKECKFPLPKGYNTEFIEMCCKDIIDSLEQSDCEVSFTKNEMIVKFTPEVFDVGKTKVSDALMKMQKEYPSYDFLDLTQSKFSHMDLREKVKDIEKKSNVKCSISKDGTSVSVFGKLFQDVKDVKDKVLSFLITARGNSDKNNSKDDKDAGFNQMTQGASNKFSWSQNTTEMQVFQTKEKITIKVYSADILRMPVDCIVNAANTDLNHGGGIARAIEKAAGKDLTKEGCDYLKQHGKLKVGEACSTGAGKMPYGCVIHAVGPRWSNYKPHTLEDVERCETDLYNAVINSFSMAEKLKMETIAVSSISSGIFGCPLDLCSIQYANAVLDYSRCSRSPLKEIHFVDTNMDMVKVMHATFHSMIPKGNIPKLYDKMKYVKSQAASKKGKKLSPRFHEQLSSKNDNNSRFDKVDSGLVSYPYCHRDYPPGHSKKEFACCFGPGQNLYIYTANILCISKKDMIACGNIPDGKTKGYLANALKVRGGLSYKAELTKAFATKVKEGDVVVCNSGNCTNFEWVAHAILHKKIHCSKDDRGSKVTSSLRNIFDEMKSKHCSSIAMPLVGTGKGKADPVFYGERFFEALSEFSSLNKDYFFKVHLVHFHKSDTETAIETIQEACKNDHPQHRRINSKKKPTSSDGQFYGARPKSVGSMSSSSSQNSNLGKRNNRYSNSTRSPDKKSHQAPWIDKDHKSTQDDWSQIEKKKDFKNCHMSPDYGKTSIRQGVVNELRRCSSFENTEMEEMDRTEISGTDRKNGYHITNDYSDITDDETYFQGQSYTANSKTKPDSNSVIEDSQKNKGNLKIFEVDSKDNSDDIHKDEKPAVNTDVDHVVNGEEDDKNAGDYENEAEDDEEEVYDDAPSEIDQDLETEDADDNEEEEVETCVICMDDISDPRTLSCGHVFCTECIEAQFNYKEACPTCGKVCGIITGDQPPGEMDMYINDRASCAGFEGCGRIEINYKFPDGIQGPNHPRPNARFKGITRKAYLPNNRRGKEICEMLKVAFERKLVFTIGNSRTTGAEGVITWNDIHHKTDQNPNSQFGYPDSTYLDRVTDELKIKGVTINDIPTLSAGRPRRR